MKKFLAIALTAAIAGTMGFAQTPIYNTITKSAFGSIRLAEVKHRRKRKKHRRHRTVAAVTATSPTSIA